MGQDRHPLWIPFGEYHPDMAARLGGKAASLHRLTTLGQPVPGGFTLTAEAFHAWLGAGDLHAPFDQVRSLLRQRAAAEVIEEEARRFRQLAADQPLPEPAREALRQGLAALGGEGPLAVRSSGGMEDHEAHSFAGLYETALDVDRDQVETAVKSCWLSLLSASSLRYLQGRGLDPVGMSMAVVVQEMVAGEYSGVCFRVNPVSGRDDELVIELTPGRGDALVSGRVDPSRVVLRQGVTGPETIESCFHDDIPPAARPPLATLLREQLAPRVRDLSAQLGVPLDVEFVVQAATVWVVQARPITAVHFAPELGEWTNADFNEGGVSAGVCSRYMWSLYDFIWRNTLPEYLFRIGLLPDRNRPIEWGRVFFGVPYWNVGAVKECLRVVPGFDERNFDQDLGIVKDYGGAPWQTPTTVATVLRALPVLFHMYREFGRQRRETEAVLRDFPRVEGYYLSVDLAETSDEVFFELYRKLLMEDYARVEGTYFMTIFNSSNAKLEFKSSFDSHVAPMAAPLSYLALMSGMRGLRTLAAVHDLHRLAAAIHDHVPGRTVLLETPADQLVERFRLREPGEEPWAGAAAYLAAHGHHSTRELDLRVPRWEEDPSFVLVRLQQVVRDLDPARDPARVEEQQHQRYLEERDRARASFGWNLPGWWFFSLALDRSRDYCWLREEARDRSTRLYRLVRRYTLELGRRLAERGVLEAPDDVFLLPFRVLLDATRARLSAEEVRAQVARVAQYQATFRDFRPPGEIGARMRPRAAAEGDSASCMRGVGGAPGVARGPARVVTDLAESHRVERGDVLVARFTDPGWTPLLEHVAGVVTEVGGVLSHAAVISREYGVPAVLSVKGATARIPDGAPVEVDGDRGQVRLLDP